MEDISKILNAISAEGEETAQKIIINSRKSVEELNRFYAEESHKASLEIMNKTEKTINEIQHRSISKAGIEARNIKLLARKKALEQAFSKAGEWLAKIEKDEKKEIYKKILMKYRNGNNVVVQLNDTDKKSIGSRLRADGVKITIDENTGDFSGGMIIKEKNIETNCTFEAIINNAKQTMESEIASILFL